MDSSTHLSSEVWLADWFANFAPGELKLADGRLSFMAIGAGTLFKWQLNKLKRDACQPGLADRMGAGENTVVFDLPLADVEVAFPWYQAPLALTVRAGGVKYYLALGKCPPDLPLNAFSRSLPGALRAFPGAVKRAVEQTKEIRESRRLWKAWKDALSEQLSPPQT